MKKIFAFVIAFLIFIVQNAPVFAYSALYYLHDTSKDTAKNIALSTLEQKKYKITKTNPIVANKINKPEDYAAIVLQESGNNLFYYFESNDVKKSKLNNAILKKFKKSGINAELSEQKPLLDSFAKVSMKAMTNSENTYDFTEPSKPAVEIKPKKHKDDTALRGAIVKMSKGTKFSVYLQNPINTATAQIGDTIIAVFNNNLFYNNTITIPQGSFLKGRVSDCHSAKAPLRNGMVKFNFTELYTPDGKILNISTESVEFNVSDEGRAFRIARSSLGSAAIGGIIGLLIGLAAGGDASSALSGLAIGAGAGAAGAVITNTASSGVDAEIPALTELEIVTTQPISLIINDI